MSLRKDMANVGSDQAQELVTLVSTPAVQAATWTHVAVTFTWGPDGKQPTCKLFSDGTLVGSVSPVVTPDARLRNPYTLIRSSKLYMVGRKEDSDDGNSWFAASSIRLKYRRASDESTKRESVGDGGHTGRFGRRGRLLPQIAELPHKNAARCVGD